MSFTGSLTGIQPKRGEHRYWTIIICLGQRGTNSFYFYFLDNDHLQSHKFLLGYLLIRMNLIDSNDMIDDGMGSLCFDIDEGSYMIWLGLCLSFIIFGSPCIG